MIYKYKLNNSINEKDIDNFLNNNLNIKKTIAKNRQKYLCFLVIILVVCYVLLVLSTKVIWRESYIKTFSIWLMLTITAYLTFPKISLSGLKKSIINREQIIEYEDLLFYYKINDKKMILNNKQDITILEIVKLESITCILIAPEKSRKFVTVVIPIVIPNDIFKSEELYNKFIKTITPTNI